MANSPVIARSPFPERSVVWAGAAVFFLTTTSVSWLRWSNFQYRTFDLAYYVQAVWQLIHGRLSVSVEDVPLLGNHVEPIVFLFAPLFAVCRHPMLFVVVQNAALASMAVIGYHLARRCGFETRIATWLGLALLLTPAAGYVAIHEFHPEALTAPLLLLMLYARANGRLWLHRLCFLGALACKENMALLLGAYCLVFLVIERRRGLAELVGWYGGPLVLAILWFALCTRVISPALNSGNIDYLSLYNRLGHSAGEIVWNVITRPQLVAGTLFQSLRHGNLVWALLLPFVGLPLLRPRWLVIATPILLQHLLSWRSSEWNIYFHYGAPLLPLFWIGAVEALVRLRDRWPALHLSTVIASLGLACVIAQIWVGPGPAIGSELLNQRALAASRARKQHFIEQIPPGASVVAPLPYLSHLAMREKLYSLHYILKGLKTLSRQRYQLPTTTGIVLIDYGDDATFDAGAGFYHPAMRTADGTTVPSSDQLLHDFLSGSAWDVRSDNELTLLQARPGNADATTATENGTPQMSIGSDTQLIGLHSSGASISATQPLELQLTWNFLARDRKVYPWMVLRLTSNGRSVLITKGLCAPEAVAGLDTEVWRVSETTGLAPGEYNAEALFVDYPRLAWLEGHGGNDWQSTLLAAPVPLGTLTVR